MKKVNQMLTVTGLRRSVIHKPLAVLMAILFMPAVSWIQSSGSRQPPPFQAQAQIVVQGCASTTNSIIQNYCLNGAIYFNDLTQLESEAVTAYLAVHSLPTTDAHLVYDTGREDLRNDIRGSMMNILAAIVLKPASQRSTHEQALYTWLQTLVQQNEITEYTTALSNFNSLIADPCHFTLDPDLAQQYKLAYDGTPFCYNSQSSIFSPMLPASSYFVAYGMKQSYQAPASQYGYFGGLVAGTGVGQHDVLSSLAILGGSVSIVYLIPVIQTVIQWAYLAYAISLTTAETLQSLDILVALAPVVGVIGTGAAYLGPLGIILDCIIAGVVAGFEIYNNQQVQNDINNLKATLAQVKATPPDLTAFLKDTIGMTKLRMTLVAQTLPDKPSNAALPAHGSSDLNFAIAPASAGAPTLTSTLAYQDWQGNSWNAQTSGGWLVETCTSAATNPCPQTDSLTASIHYVDWNGVDWIGSRAGDKFVSTKASPATTDTLCAPDSTGVSPGTNFSTCSTYISRSLPLTDAKGNHASVSLSTLSAPVFTSPTALSFGPGVPSTQTITATGNPAPNICVVSSSLPGNFSFPGGNCGNGSLPLAFNGDVSAPLGVYSLTLSAQNTAGTVQSILTVNVATQLAIISASTMNVTSGVPANFKVVATGVPAPKLSMDSSFFLGGLTFNDNGDGTGTIGGVYSANVTLSCQHIVPPGPCGIIATNSQGTVEQQFSLNVSFPPPAVISGCTFNIDVFDCPGTTFYAGTPNQILLTTSGATTPVTSWSLAGTGGINPSPLPPWLTLHDNGNGTATLSGTPPGGTAGTFLVQISVTTAFAGVNQIHYYPVTVSNTPVFTSASLASLTAGSAASLSISANMGTVSLTGTLPTGLTFTAGNPATIGGTPAAGTGGQYTLTLTDDAGAAGTATQRLILNVNDAPKITSQNTATMFVGTPGMFAVTTTGFPSISTHALPANPLPPTDPSQGNGMYFAATGLPLSLRASNLDSAGFGGGTLTIQGTPTAGDVGMHAVQITAQNGVGQPATQALMLNIVQITGAAPASGTQCNGNYSGTFTGSISISAGQNCAFFGGGVTANIEMTGGSLALLNATVGGNLAILGGSAFSIGLGTTINGNLAISNVGSGSTASQICEAKVTGNLEVSNNAIPIAIGSPQTFCFGNTLGKNVDIQGNTGAVSLYNNSIGKNLGCSGNVSIKGGANTAQKKEGQCAAF
ncbi:MAG TPA: putative Ig domain-containing protein [Candidatus Acidoferrales bacterium]|jgi:hypothetical protein|nr:putative Ig domain-containing protein [Candidatus Acidoferrales bacterium]